MLQELLPKNSFLFVKHSDRILNAGNFKKHCKAEMMTESRVVITGKQIGLTDNRSKTKSIEEKMNTLSESCI